MKISIVANKFVRKFRKLAMYLLINTKKMYLNIFPGPKTSPDEFRSNGIINLHAHGLSDILNAKFEHASKFGVADSNEDSDFLLNKDGKIKTIWLDLEDDFFWKYIFTPDVFNAIKGYINHDKFYLRNRPSLSVVYPNEEHGAQEYHVDWGLNQITLMVNISNVDDSSTHMEYIQGTNNKFWFSAPNRNSETFKKKVANCLTNPNYSTITTKAPRDTLFIFDAGNGIHRQVLGGPRIILHMNFVDNLAYTNWENNWVYNPSMEKHWYIKRTENLTKKIENSIFFERVFDLVFHEMKPSILTPKIYSKNFDYKRD